MTVMQVYILAALLVVAGMMELSLISKSRLAVWARGLSALGFVLLATRFGWLAYTGEVTRLHILGSIPIAIIAAARVCIGALAWKGRL